MAIRKRPKKPTRGMDRRYYPSERDAQKVKNALMDYDRVVRGVEARFGIDRLPDLVDAEMRDRWWKQWDILNEAIEGGRPDVVERAVEVTIRACGVLEARALELGAKPLTGDRWEAELPDGGVMAIVRDQHEVAGVQADGRYDAVYCVAEVAKIIHGWRQEDGAKTVEAVKAMFGGAVVEEVKRPKTALEVELNDEIPF